MSSSQIAENYQLKWHSHLTNLNSSVATLFRNDKFADVLLFTSQLDGGCGIPAHKIILSSCSHFFAQVFDTNPALPNSMVYIVLPPEISRRSIQILIQYMYSGEATVSNDILNEVLHGGELLKIRGLCRNKQTHPTSSVESNAVHYATSETVCEKLIYDQHPDRSSGGAVIKESPVIVTSPHKPSSSATISGSGTCPPEQESHKKNSMSFGLKTSVVRNHCTYNSPPTPLHMKSSVHNEHGHMPPPTQIITTPTSLIHSPDSHSTGSSNSVGIKKESMTINAMNDELVSVPASHYGLVSLQIAAAVKKAQQISEKRCTNSTTHLYQKSHMTNAIVNNHEPQSELHGNHVENGTNSAATITQTATNNNYVRRYSDDYFVKDDLPSGSHLHHQQQPSDFTRKPDKELPQQKQLRTNSTGSFDKIASPMTQQQTTQMAEDVQMMAIKQEPVEWSDFEHENANATKSSIEVTVKPELIYTKGDTDEEATEQQEPIYSPLTCELCSETFTVPAEWVRHIENHSENTHCVPKKRKHIESTALSENIAALRCDLCEMYFVTPAEWVRHVQNHTETELALSNSNASLRQTNTVSNASHRSRQQSQHIESTKYAHPQSNSHR